MSSLLQEGDDALAQGQIQKAIDTWSRIFLIEMDHDEATQKIEQAQRLKAERERELEERVNEASQLLEAGDEQAALAAFQSILEIEPDHLAAKEIVDQLRAPKDAAVEGVGSETTPDDATTVPESDTGLAPPPREARPTDDEDEDKVPPIPDLGVAGDASRMPPKPPSVATPPSKAKISPNWRFVGIGSAVLALVALVAVLLISNWGNLFPNAEQPVTAENQPLDRVARITLLHERGDTEQAIEALKQILADSPDYERAQLLLEEWTADTPLTAEEAEIEESRKRLIEQAREAYAGGEYLSAARSFVRATATAPLEEAEAALFEDSKRQIEPIASMIDLFTQREYQRALPGLWRYHEEHPENRDVYRLLVNAHYNMAVRSLRRGDPQGAQAAIDEAVRLDFDDAYAQRLQLFAQTYAGAPRDLLYEIFIENLELRP